MKAKDSVMDRFDIAKRIDHILVDNPNAGGLYLSYKIAEQQAEISFKAGIKEVVEWLKENDILCQHNRTHARQLVKYCGDDGISHTEPKLVYDELCLRCKWQAYINKWEVNSNGSSKPM